MHFSILTSTYPHTPHVHLIPTQITPMLHTYYLKKKNAMCPKQLPQIVLQIALSVILCGMGPVRAQLINAIWGRFGGVVWYP